MSVQLVGTSHAPGRSSHYLVPVLLLVIVAAVVGVVLTIPTQFFSSHRGSPGAHPGVTHVPPYYYVRPGDTMTEISARTGLSVNQLEALNPYVLPDSLVPGQRLDLWRHPPAPRPPPPGPMFWTVRPGQSFGSIAAATGINIVALEDLNPRLKATTLQPGERVRLRPGHASPAGGTAKLSAAKSLLGR
jgi:LysM repeat protein